MNQKEKHLVREVMFGQKTTGAEPQRINKRNKSTVIGGIGR